MVQLRASTVQQEREEVSALQYAAVSHCLVEWKECEEPVPKPKEKWCMNTKVKQKTSNGMVCGNQYRCMRCGRNIKKHAVARDMLRTNVVTIRLQTDKAHLGGTAW